MKRAGKLSAFAAVVALAAAISPNAFAAAEDAIGTWKDNDTGGITQIYTCDGGVCVKIVTPSQSREKDDNNPDPALKGRSMAGVVIMSGAAKDGADRWKGKIYNSEDGKEYTGYIEVKSKDEVKLEGCILGGILCKTRVWRRVQ
jgi:uncharacterized protein (DUF2147 family)